MYMEIYPTARAAGYKKLITKEKFMRALLQSRVSLFSVPGGDTVQVVRTAEALLALGNEHFESSRERDADAAAESVWSEWPTET